MSVAVQEVSGARLRPVASWGHSITLIAAFLLLAVAGAFFQGAGGTPRQASEHPKVLPTYLSLLAMQWGLFFYVWRKGLRRSRTTLREMIGGRWSSPSAVVFDLAIAAVMWAGWTVALLLLQGWFGAGKAASIAGYLPRGPIESALWILLSLSAGFCEELVFRGYFQRQFAAWTGNVGIGVALQAALFGIAHGYQGWEACVRIGCFGAFYGMMAMWLKSLRPGMIAHALTDIMGGIVRI